MIHAPLDKYEKDLLAAREVQVKVSTKRDFNTSELRSISEETPLAGWRGGSDIVLCRRSVVRFPGQSHQTQSRQRLATAAALRRFFGAMLLRRNAAAIMKIFLIWKN